MTFKLDYLSRLQDEVAEWHARELSPNPNPLATAAKVCEEAGELVGAVIKFGERRDDGTDWNAETRKEMGDVLISLCMAAQAQGWSLRDVVGERWATVSQRTFATRPTE